MQTLKYLARLQLHLRASNPTFQHSTPLLTHHRTFLTWTPIRRQDAPRARIDRGVAAEGEAGTRAEGAVEGAVVTEVVVKGASRVAENGG